MNIDNYNYTGSLDRNRINIHENYEVEIWANKFEVRPEQLKKAVATVGESSAAIEQYFKIIP